MPVTEGPTPVDQIKLVGGNPALDFANTVAWDENRPIVERLNDYGDLLTWAEHAGVLEGDVSAELRRVAGEQAAEAQAVVERAVALRGAIHRIFSALSHEMEPDAADLDLFNHELAGAMAHSRIARSAEGFAWDWETTATLDRLLWPILRAAADLLASTQLPRVRECAGEHCGWLFVDTSKSGRRRWCTMEDCGNRAKARRHYHRHKQEPQSAA